MKIWGGNGSSYYRLDHAILSCYVCVIMATLFLVYTNFVHHNYLPVKRIELLNNLTCATMHVMCTDMGGGGAVLTLMIETS
jgi:hypothetical protein